MRVLITGANRGIGLELARQLGARGDEVIGSAREPGRAEALRVTGARVVGLDVREPTSVRGLVDALAGTPLDLLVNNAGRGGRGPGIAELDWEIVADHLATNALGPLRLTQALLPNLRAGRSRRIVHLSSELGSIGGNTSGGSYGYRASKAALNMLNRTLAIELAADRFTCVVVHPGWVRTDMGGPSAPLPVERAVADLVALLDRLEPALNGRFVDRAGADLAW